MACSASWRARSVVTLTAPGSVNAGSAGNTASVPAGPGGTTYSWSISGGTITGGNGTPSVTFTAGLSGFALTFLPGFLLGYAAALTSWSLALGGVLRRIFDRLGHSSGQLLREDSVEFDGGFPGPGDQEYAHRLPTDRERNRRTDFQSARTD